MTAACAASAGTLVTSGELARRDAWVKASFERLASPTLPPGLVGRANNDPVIKRADLPFTEESPMSGAPFSFLYGGRTSTELLPSWERKEEARKLDKARTERTIS